MYDYKPKPHAARHRLARLKQFELFTLFLTSPKALIELPSEYGSIKHRRASAHNARYAAARCGGLLRFVEKLSPHLAHLVVVFGNLGDKLRLAQTYLTERAVGGLCVNHIVAWHDEKVIS